MAWPPKIAHSKPHEIKTAHVKVMFPDGPRLMPASQQVRSLNIGGHNYLRYVWVPDYFSGFRFEETTDGEWYAFRDGEYT